LLLVVAGCDSLEPSPQPRASAPSPAGSVPARNASAPQHTPSPVRDLPNDTPLVDTQVSPTPLAPLAVMEPAATPSAAAKVGPLADVGQAVAVDSDGNVFVAGMTLGVLDGAQSHGGADGFVSKWAADGTWLWTQQFGTANSDVVHGVAIAPDGDIVIAGRTAGQYGQEPALGAVDAFVARLDPEGAVRWLHQFGSEGVDYATALAVSRDGAIYVTSAERQNLDQDRGASALRRFDADGTMRWRDEWGGTPAAESVALAEREGVVYVVGRSQLHYDPQFWGASAGGAWTGVGFVRRYDASGQLNWERTIDAKGSEASAVAIDAELGAIVVGSTFGAVTATANAGAFDGFMLRFTPNGTMAWTRQFGTLGWDDARGVAILPDHDIVVGGNAVGDFDGDPTTGYGGFVMRCDAQGERRWQRQAFADTVFALAVGPDQRAYLTGWLFSAQPPAASEFEADAYVVGFDGDGTRTWREAFGAAPP
jgi:hypothetical protein